MDTTDTTLEPTAPPTIDDDLYSCTSFYYDSLKIRYNYVHKGLNTFYMTGNVIQHSTVNMNDISAQEICV